MSDWIFSSKSSGLGFCWSTPCQHLLKQDFNAPAPTIFLTKYGVRGGGKRGGGLREKMGGGSRSGGQKPSVQTEPTVFKFNQLYARPLSILPFFPSLFQSISVSLSSSLCFSLSLFLCLPNNGLFVMQEANSTSIIRPSFHPHHHHHLVLYCNKYANEQKPVIGNFKLDSLVLKKDTNVLIASGQRNPIFCGHWLQNWCELLFFCHSWLYDVSVSVCACVCIHVKGKGKAVEWQRYGWCCHMHITPMFIMSRDSLDRGISQMSLTQKKYFLVC